MRCDSCGKPLSLSKEEFEEFMVGNGLSDAKVEGHCDCGATYEGPKDGFIAWVESHICLKAR